MLLRNRTSSCTHDSFLIFCALFISVYSRKNVKHQIEIESLILLETVCRSRRHQLLNHNKIINSIHTVIPGHFVCVLLVI